MNFTSSVCFYALFRTGKKGKWPQTIFQPAAAAADLSNRQLQSSLGPEEEENVYSFSLVCVGAAELLALTAQTSFNEPVRSKKKKKYMYREKDGTKWEEERNFGHARKKKEREKSYLDESFSP